MPTIAEMVTIKENKKVTLEMKIGSGQIGGYAILLGGQMLEPESETPSRAVYDLGLGNDLRWKVLIGTVKVKDVQAATNQTTVTITVKHGGSAVSFRDKEEANEGGIVHYGVSLAFR